MRLPGGVADVLTTGGVFAGVGNAGTLQAEAVGDYDVAATGEVDGVVGGDLVEFGGGGHALLGEVGLVPAAGADEPLVWGHLAGLLSDGLEEFADGADVGKLEGVPAEGGAEEVVVAVDEAGHYDPARQVHDGCAGGHLAYGRVGAKTDDAAVVDGHGGESTLQLGLAFHGNHATGVDVGYVGAEGLYARHLFLLGRWCEGCHNVTAGRI